MSTDYSEDALVEQPVIALFNQLGYETGRRTHRGLRWASGETLLIETLYRMQTSLSGSGGKARKTDDPLG